MKKKLALIIGVIIVVISLVIYSYYRKIYQKNVTVTTSIHIPSDTDLDELVTILQPHLKNVKSFKWVAEKKKYVQKIRAGKFRITEGMNNNDLVNHLRSGKQETITLTFNNQDDFFKLAGRVAVQIEADSISLLHAMTDSVFLHKNGFDSRTAIAMYIPNSYDFYWNTDAEKFRDKMYQEFQKFWNADRINQAQEQNLNPLQVATLASIVQKETAVIAERKTVAGLYVNRLKDYWPLQADPTIIFALKQKNGQDKEYKRVLTKDLSIDSPYNTYSNFGLPPGPIGMPDISSLEAVLRPEQHNYYYMCASVEQIGYHKFAKTLKQHNINAAEYQRWVSKQGINR